MSFPEERTAVVTGVGAPAGIGRRIARRLLQDGFDVALTDIREEGMQALGDELRQQFPERKIITMPVDVADAESVGAMYERVVHELPQLTALVNPAGVACPTSIEDAAAGEFDHVFAVNARGTFLMMQGAFRHMKNNGRGYIVNFSSITAFDGGGTFSKALYAGAKAAVIGLTRGAAREFGPFGVNVNVITPGPVDTEIMGGPLTSERKRLMAANIPLGRVGQPEEIANVCSFLVSPDSSFMTGSVVSVDGGKHMR